MGEKTHPIADLVLRVRSWRLEVVLLVIAFFVAYGALLYKTDGLPYVFDNNESFSAFVHGSNLYRFDLSRSFGLTDEAYGPDASAHPYVYTHQGNFPRLFSFLLYTAGARSVEAQIVLTTFTVGLGTILLAYLFFFRLAGRLYGTVVAALFLTDYIFSAQWLVNTFKVWHGFLLFGLLSALQAYFIDRRTRWLVLTTAAAACIGYFDLMLGVFSFALGALFILAECRRVGWGGELRAFAALGLGGVVSVALLLLQLVGYYGVDGLAKDLYLTFMGRNYATSDPAVSEQWRNFFTGKHIVFWEMLVDSGVYTGPGVVVRSLFVYGLSVFTPYFSFVVLALVSGKALSMVPTGQWSGGRSLRVAAEFLAWMGAHFLVTTILLTSNLETASDTGAALPVATSGIAVLIFSALLSTVFVALTHDRNRTNAGQLFILAAYFFVLSSLLRYHEALYHVVNGHPRSIWAHVMLPWRASGSPKLFALLAAGCGAWWILGRQETRPARHQLVRHGQALRFICLVGIAFLAGYYFSPGYMQIINLQRYAPILVFLLLPIVAWGFCCAIEDASTTRRLLQASPRLGGFHSLTAPLALLLSIHMVVFWLSLQKIYIQIAPPDGAKVFKLLDQPPYRGASFVVNSYGAPIAAKTDSWAYVDQAFFSKARYNIDEHGYLPDGTDLYKWFADRDNELKYRNPDFALCVHMYPGFYYALRAVSLWNDARRYGIAMDDIFAPTMLFRHVMEKKNVLSRKGLGCETDPLTAKALQGHTDELQLSVVARDPALVDRWAIIELENDFPPYLASLKDKPSEQVGVEVKRSHGRCVAVLAYQYRQQQGKVEGDTVMEAWLEPAVGRGRRKLYSGPAMRAIPMPVGAAGRLVVSVVPRSATREGRKFTSSPTELPGC